MKNFEKRRSGQTLCTQGGKSYMDVAILDQNAACILMPASPTGVHPCSLPVGPEPGGAAPRFYQTWPAQAWHLPLCWQIKEPTTWLATSGHFVQLVAAENVFLKVEVCEKVF